MSGGAVVAGRNIALKLDPRMALEALILNRLGRLPRTRRPEWLRGLLVQGFVSECRMLRTVEPGVSRWGEGDDVNNRFASGSLADCRSQRPVPDTRNHTPPANESVRGRKPLAALRKVIG